MTEVSEQVDAYVDECAKSTTLGPPNSPLDVLGGSSSARTATSSIGVKAPVVMKNCKIDRLSPKDLAAERDG